MGNLYTEAVNVLRGFTEETVKFDKNFTTNSEFEIRGTTDDFSFKCNSMSVSAMFERSAIGIMPKWSKMFQFKLKDYASKKGTVSLGSAVNRTGETHHFQVQDARN